MTPDERLDEVFDELVELALRGEALDLDAFLAARADLSEDEKSRVRARARVLTGAPRGALPFERLGDFRLLRKLGEGGMGVVYLARQESLGRVLALKLMRPELSGSESAERRFEREARAVAQLRHPAIAAVHAAGVENGVRYLAMDFIEGRSLDQLLREEGAPIAPARAVRWGRDLARALECAHAAGVVHRDVKPSNVRIDGDDRALLVDFGLALLADASQLSAGGEFLGTPSYASPEQVEARLAPIDARTDVYSLGATLYHCVTGRPPHEGESKVAVFHAILSREPAAPRKLVPRLSRDIETVVLKALEKDRNRRYPDAGALARDLEALLEMRPVVARPTGPATRVLKWTRRNRVAALALASAGLLLAGLVATRALERAGRARRFENELADAAASRERGEFDQALRALERALFLRPDDARALAQRGETERASASARSREAVESARRSLAAYRASASRGGELEAELFPLAQAITMRPMTAEESARMTRLEAEQAALDVERDALFARVIEAVNLARGLDAEASEASDVLADLYMERWRSAHAAGDWRAARDHRGLVVANDASGRHAAELNATVAVSLATEPPGAEAFLFRYLEQAEVVSGGERRLVPVPVPSGAATPRPPGTWALRVVAGASGAVPEGFEPEDLVLSVAGHPIEGTLLAPEPGQGVDRLDRLVSVDGAPMRDAYDAWWIAERGGADAEREFVFERAGERFALRATKVSELVPSVLTPRALVARGGIPIEVWRRGEIAALESPPALETRTTAAPLFRAPSCRAGTTPIDALELEPGSYLALVCSAGFENVRLPFTVAANAPARIELRLDPTGTAPPGTVRVAAGGVPLGGDAEAFAPFEGGVRELPDYWIQEHEVAVGEYLEFLNDPRTLAEVGASSAPILFPRDEANAESGGLWRRGADGAYAPSQRARNDPVPGVSWTDGQAYARWRTERARAEGRPFEYALPAELEWEKAARGADARAFPFGNHFVPRWVKGYFSRDRLLLEPAMSFPVDESPYGVFDLAGGTWEWCQEEFQGGRALRGGGYNFTRPQFFRAASRAGVAADSADFLYGLRLVARRVGAAAETR